MTCCDGCNKWFHWNCIEEKMGEETMEMARDEGSQKCT